MISYAHAAGGSDIAELPRFLLGLSENYPDFQDWLSKKAIPSLGGEGEIVLAKQGYEIVGVALGKKNNHREKDTMCSCCRKPSKDGYWGDPY